MIRTFGADAMWTAAAILLAELMRVLAALIPGSRRALPWLRSCSILLATTVALGFASVILSAVGAASGFRVVCDLAYMGVDIAALPCLVVGTALLIGGARPPGPPRRRTRRATAVRAAA